MYIHNPPLQSSDNILLSMISNIKSIHNCKMLQYLINTCIHRLMNKQYGIEIQKSFVGQCIIA